MSEIDLLEISKKIQNAIKLLEILYEINKNNGIINDSSTIYLIKSRFNELIIIIFGKDTKINTSIDKKIIDNKILLMNKELLSMMKTLKNENTSLENQMSIINSIVNIINTEVNNMTQGLKLQDEVKV